MKSLFLAFLMLVSVGCGSTEQPVVNLSLLPESFQPAQLIAEYPQFRAIYEQYQPSASRDRSGKCFIRKIANRIVWHLVPRQ